MYLAWAGLMVLLLVAYSGAAVKRRPLDRRELDRVRRISDQLRREETWPYD